MCCPFYTHNGFLELKGLEREFKTPAPFLRIRTSYFKSQTIDFTLVSRIVDTMSSSIFVNSHALYTPALLNAMLSPPYVDTANATMFLQSSSCSLDSKLGQPRSNDKQGKKTQEEKGLRV